MNLRKSIVPILNIALIFIFIVPFIYTTRFIYLSADDFCRASSNFTLFFENIKDWYLHHNGRYVNAVFSYLPLYNIVILRVFAALNFVLLGITLYSFIGFVLKLYNVVALKSRRLFFSLILYIVILAQLPSLFEFFYWYATITAYLLSFIFLIIFLQFVLKSYYDIKHNPYVVAILIVLINGNNEILIGVTNFLLLVLLLSHFFKRKKWDKNLFFLNIISWISTLLVIISPGSTERRIQYDYGGNLIGSVKVAIIYGGKFLVESFFEISFLLFYLFAFLFVYHKVHKTIIKAINPILLLFVSYLSIISLFFIVYYATGLLQVYTGRIGSMVRIVSIIFLLLNVINLAVYLKPKLKSSLLNHKYASRIVLSILLIFLIFENNNLTDLQKDYFNESLKNYANNMEFRVQQIKSSKSNKIQLPRMEGTLILKSDDYNLTSQEWLRDCYKTYFNQEYNLDIEEISLEESTSLY